MGKTILDIYAKYKIMPLLQEHMLRVAAVANMICDSSLASMNKESVIAASLLHDMGNIIKSDLAVFPEYLEPEGILYWQKVKEDYIKKYGSDEHQASIKILREVGVVENIVELVNGVDFSQIPSMETKSIEQQICLYADARVAPFGVVSFSQRLAEGKERYKNKKHKIADTEWELVERIFEKVEKKLFAQCKIKPEDISDKTVALSVEKLRSFTI